MFKRIMLITSLLVLNLLGVHQGFAQTKITITSEKVSGIPIAVVPFVSATQLPQPINQIIDNDLRSSGKFAPIAPRKFLVTPKNIDDVQYQDWLHINAEILIVGEVKEIPPGLFEVQYKIYDIAKQKPLGAGSYQANADQLRELSHLISDEVYKNIIGIKGAYQTKLAFVKRVGGTSQLQVADWDGYNATTIVTSTMPIISPTWSPNGKSIAFVNFDGGNSVIRTVDLDTGAVKTIIKSRRGFNSAPAWSPNNKQLAYASSRSGNPEIYIFDVDLQRTRKLTNHWGIDTEPTWAIDGKSIVFTSNRSGKANLYEVAIEGGRPKRLTFEGKESAGAEYSPDGKYVVYVKDGGVVTVMNKASGVLRKLSARKYDESPSFSPNSEMVMYASQQANKGRIIVSSRDGRARHTLKYLSGDVREPSWSPYTSDQ